MSLTGRVLLRQRLLVVSFTRWGDKKHAHEGGKADGTFHGVSLFLGFRFEVKPFERFLRLLADNRRDRLDFLAGTEHHEFHSHCVPAQFSDFRNSSSNSLSLIGDQH